MKLKKLTLKNFRAYKNEEFDLDDLNVIIGKNDVGKSTILDALNIFFNSSPDIKDLNIQAEEKYIEISCAFEVDATAQIQLDASENTSTTLRDEYLLDKGGLLRFCKRYEGDKLKEKMYIIARHPTNFDKPLITMKINELKNMVKEKNIDTSTVNQTIKKSLRNALLNSEELNFLDDYKIDVNIKETDAIDIYSKFVSQFPTFLLFKADRTNTDKDAEVTDTLTAITKTAVDELATEFEEIKSEINNKIRQIATETLNKLKEFDPYIARGLNPDIKNKALEKIFEFSFNDEKGISFNKKGSGVKRLMLLSFFLAEAERMQSSEKDIIYAIEEPETSQHPDFQIKLINAFINLSQKEHKQILITTHTPEIVKLVDKKTLIFLQKDVNENIIKEQQDTIEIAKVRKTLGILPFVVHKGVIFVEGKTDANFLNNLSEHIRELREIIDLRKYTIVPLRGCGEVNRWMQEDYLANSNVKCFYFKDRDKQSISYALEHEDNVIITNRREIENYIPKNIIEEEFNIHFDENIDWNNEDISNAIIQKGCQLSEESIKEILSGKTELWNKIEVQGYHEEEVIKWFQQIKNYFSE